MPSRKVRIDICGSNYVIQSDDPEDYVIALAEKLDGDMKDVMQRYPAASVASAAIITALGYLDSAHKSARAADNMRAQLQDYLEDSNRARTLAEETRNENDRLRRELAHYKTRPIARATAPKGTPGPADAPEAEPIFEPAPRTTDPDTQENWELELEDEQDQLTLDD